MFNSDPMFNGRIDDFRIYNYALSEEEVKKVMKDTGEISEDIQEDDEPDVLKGDVNEDGFVNISDVVALINQMAGTANYRCADVNEDNEVDISDVVAVINIMAGGQTEEEGGQNEEEDGQTEEEDGQNEEEGGQNVEE